MIDKIMNNNDIPELRKLLQKELDNKTSMLNRIMYITDGKADIRLDNCNNMLPSYARDPDTGDELDGIHVVIFATYITKDNVPFIGQSELRIVSRDNGTFGTAIEALNRNLTLLTHSMAKAYMSKEYEDLLMVEHHKWFERLKY